MNGYRFFQGFLRRFAAGVRDRSGFPGAAGTALIAVVLSMACLIPMSQASVAASDGLGNRGLFAIVNGEKVTRQEFENFAAGYVRSKTYHGASTKKTSELRVEAGNALILRKLISQEAEKRGVTGDMSGVDEKIRAYEERYRESPMWPQIKTQIPKLKNFLLESSKNSVLAEIVRQVPDPDDSALQEYYRNNLQLFTEPPRDRISIIVVGVRLGAAPEEWESARVKAERLFTELQNGADFAELAKQHSQHESAKQGGDMGYRHKGSLSKEVEAELDKLNPGKFTLPLQLLQGYGIFKLTDRKAQRVREYSDVRKRAKALFTRQRSSEKWERFISGLQRTANIQVDETVYSEQTRGPGLHIKSK